MTTSLQIKLKHYRISSSEYTLICDLLGREPQGLEWALFSALWSEHCSYKSSRVHFKKFYSKNARVLQSEGENAGVIDIGMGERICFKMESHNHPSFIEPFQGAATGVGGILRDIFTMGARPIGVLDYLCFGRPNADRMASLVKGVVSGISHYGNCVGVPNIGGATDFHSTYNQNILVNAMAIGYLGPNDKVAISKAAGVGNLVMYVGAKTGRDGVHGASMASESFDEDSESKRPNVQIGDPFYEKLLIESCLAAIQQDLVVAIQDMGAAGLTSSSFEMAAKGQIGMNLYLDKVPVRDASISPEEIMLSESQERMLAVVEPSKLEKFVGLFNRWGLDAVCVGELISERKVNIHFHKEVLCSIDPLILTDNAPLYKREYKTWEPSQKVKQGEKTLPNFNSIKEIFSAMIEDARLTPKCWIYEQYDQRVGASTALDASNTVGMVQLQSSKRGLLVATGCRSHLMRMDARLGAIDSVIYPALQVSVKGGTPMAVTDCLNFGNPEKVEVMSEFVASIEGISEACEALDAPVISGNVSFYNETLGKSISPTPAIGLIATRPDCENTPGDCFNRNGDTLVLLSLPLVYCSGVFSDSDTSLAQFSGELDPFEMGRYAVALRKLSQNKGISAMRMVGSGGILPTLVKMANANIGVKIKTNNKPQFFAQERFYESLIAIDSAHLMELKKFVADLKIEFSKVQLLEMGFTANDVFEINDETWSLRELKVKWADSWRKHFEILA
jgi:phosphoribosylformylglycinamidine synthase subunit PurL